MFESILLNLWLLKDVQLHVPTVPVQSKARGQNTITYTGVILFDLSIIDKLPEVGHNKVALIVVISSQ